MAELTTKARAKLPTDVFAGPGRSYPIPDRSHAANAKARATQQGEKGNLSAGEVKAIKSKADRVLEKGGLKKKAKAPAAGSAAEEAAETPAEEAAETTPDGDEADTMADSGA